MFCPDSEFPAPYYVLDLSVDEVQKIGDFGDVWLWHMDAEEDMLVAIEIDWDKHPPEVQQTKLTFTGQLLDKKHFSLLPSGRGPEETRFRADPWRFGRTFGHKTVTRLHSVDDDVMMDLIYDHAVDKLSLLRINHSVPPKATLFIQTFALLTPYISYQLNLRRERFHICNTANSTSALHRYQPDCREFISDEITPIGDREVLGLVSDYGIQLWFFNPNFVPELPDEYSFRAKRM
ncbi:hypothetical protein VTN49DRAFT_1931 [Thermomyces lanuginosus]|uniref:uncharacterized protein n=1 Tax=Thermomyces lanuginosus TaxID=5541 RepID=UPI0037439C47